MCFARDDGAVGNHGWLIEVFLAAFVGASEFFFAAVASE